MPGLASAPWIAIAGLLVILASSGLAQDLTQPNPPPSDLTQLSLRQLMEVKIETVYTASKHEQKVTEAPSSVSIVTGDEIKKYGHRTLADTLRSVRGLYVTYDRNYHYLGIRGFNRPGDYSTRVLLLVDGQRLNDNVYDSAPIGTEFPIDVDLIERVEVIRGPSSSLYGNNAFFGVINVITKRGGELQSVEASGEVASYDTYKGRFSYGGKSQQGWELLLSGSIYDSLGPRRLYFPEFDDPATSYGIADRLDYDRFKSLFAKLAYRDFSLSAAFETREKGIPTGSFGTVFNDPRAQTIDETAYVNLTYQHQFENEIEVTARLSYDRYHYDGAYPYDLAAPGDPPLLVLNKDFARGEWWGGELQVSRQFFDRLRFSAGVEYRNNVRQDQLNYDDEPRVAYLDDQRDSQNVGLYGQGEFVLRTNLLLSAGVRYDYSSGQYETANPRLGLIYTPWEETTFKLLYGSAFRAPNVYELYFSDGFTAKTNPDLRPERIHTYELVYEQCLKGPLRLSLAGYYYDINDLISQTIDPADNMFVFNNIEEIHALGLETGLEATFENGWSGRLSYARQRAEQADTHARLSNSPGHLAKLNVIAPLVEDKLFAGLELMYSSSVNTLIGNKVDDYWTANLTLFSRRFAKGMELSASVYNLFDQRYGYPGAGEHAQAVLLQDGRSFRVKLTYRF